MNFYTKSLYRQRPAMAKILLVMRLIVVLLTTAILQVSAAGYAQKISLTKRSAPLIGVFNDIRNQSGYDFVFTTALLENAKPVSINVKNTELKEVLDKIFENQPLTYSIEDKTVVVSKKESSVLDRIIARFQSIDVRGKVVDSLGNGLAGATVSVKSGKGSTSTDAGGNFQLRNVDEGAVLVVSYLGYVTKEVAVNKEFMSVVLQQSESKLDEVQVIAYGNTTKRLNTGSIQGITQNEIKNQPVNNLLFALQGRIAGLQITPTSGIPGAPVSVQIRGQNSIRSSISGNMTGSADPLIVVDGLPILNNINGAGGHNSLNQMSALSFLNPADIRSIDVLKDADATSIYGSRGANGVILITTRRGRSETTNVDISLNTGVSQVGKKVKLLNTAQYLELRKEAHINSGLNLEAMALNSSNADVKFWDSQRFTDWQNVLMGGSGTYHHIQGSINGGSNLLNYIISGNYRKDGSVFTKQHADQKGGAFLNLRGSSPNQKLTTTVSLSFTSNSNTLPGVDFTQAALTLAPNAPELYKPDGTLNWELLPNGRRSWTNPYSELLRVFELKNQNLMASGEIRYEISPWFSATTQFGYNRLSGKSFKAEPIAAAGPDETDVIGAANFGTNQVTNVSVEPLLTFNQRILNGKLEALIGGSYQTNSVGNEMIFAAGFTNDALLKSYNAADRQYTSINNTSSEYKYTAVFSRLAYNLYDKYIINIAVRRDGSSRFGPKNKFGNFGSLAGAWIFTEEKLIKKGFSWLTFGKLRASYGVSGNDGIGDYQYLERYSIDNDLDDYQGIKGYRSNGIFNEYYHWENTRKFEIGLELGLINRLLFTTNLFRNTSDSQLIPYPYPSTVGFGEALFNFPALIENRGLEFIISSQNIKNLNFSWSTGLNWSILSNKLLKFPGIENTPYYYMNEIGKSFYGLDRTFHFSGVNPHTGRYEFVLADGTIGYDPTDNLALDGGAYIRTHTAPKFSGGLTNTFSYNGFSLDFFLQFTKQMGIDPINNYITRAGNAQNLPVGYLNRWQEDGDITDIQKVFARIGSEQPGYRQSATWRGSSDAKFTDASFIRLKNVSVSYKLSAKITERLHFRSIKLFALGQNLYTLTSYKGLDPETQSMTSLPPLRTITAGLNIGF